MRRSLRRLGCRLHQRGDSAIPRMPRFISAWSAFTCTAAMAGGRRLATRRRRCAFDPELALAHYHISAMACRRYLSRGEAAVAALRQAVTLDPSLADAFDRLGDLLDQHAAGVLRGHRVLPARSRAARAGDRCWPSELRVRADRGRVVLAVAEASLRQAVGVSTPITGVAHWVLGSMLVLCSGRFDAAIECPGTDDRAAAAIWRGLLQSHLRQANHRRRPGADRQHGRTTEARRSDRST